MPKNRKARKRATVESLNLFKPESEGISTEDNETETKRAGTLSVIKRYRVHIATVILVFLVCLGVMASNNWLPSTDLSGKKTGWFGRVLSKPGAVATGLNPWNPFAVPPPDPMPQLTREYLYSGSRLLNSIDAGASEIPPADLAVWRPSDGTWRILGGGNPSGFGLQGDSPIQGDFDGDGKTDFSVVRPLPTPVMWYVLNSSTESMTSTAFSITGDQPVPADYDGDNKTDLAVYRPGNQTWYIVPSSSTVAPPYNMIAIQYGSSGDLPVPRDFDGDGLADLAYWRASNHTFYSKNSSDGQTRTVSIGSTTSIPVCADYDGDGKADFSVLSGQDWIILSSSTNTTSTTNWQLAESGPVPDVPVPNDYDGDGKVDIAIWRVSDAKGNPGVWYIRQSHDLSLRLENWGKLGDIPVPALYRR